MDRQGEFDWTGPRNHVFNSPGLGLSFWSRRTTLILEKGLEGKVRVHTEGQVEMSPNSQTPTGWSLFKGGCVLVTKT